jgi:DinB superfamily
MGPTTDEERRILSYLQGQGAKLSPPALIEKVQAAMEEVHKAAASVPAGRFNERPAAGEWSANQVMAHVVRTGARICDSIAQILDGALAPPAAPVSGADSARPAVPGSAASSAPARPVASSGSVAAIVDEIEAGAPERSADEWWDRLVRDRTALFERVRRADPGAHLDRAIEHPMFGPLNWREALLFLRIHDVDHAGQLQKIATALQ